MPVHFYGFLPQNPHLFPFDPIPRVISAEDFSYLERGLKQRVDALNLFLSDVYGAKNIIKMEYQCFFRLYQGNRPD